MTPLERAAIAMAKTDNLDPSALIGDPPQPLWRLYLPKVRAVIAAIREPSEAMTFAVDEAANGHGEYIWRSMINALLAEEG